MRIYLLTIALAILSLCAYGKKVPGIIIVNGKVKDVTFDIKVPLLGSEPNFERIQYKVRYYDENGKKKTLRPGDAEEINFYYQGKEVRMISCVNTLGLGDIFSNAEKLFLKLEIDGPLRLYRYYFKQSTGGYSAGAGVYTPGMTYTVENFIFQKGNDALMKPRSLRWRKDMLEYFNDCPGLREQIEAKDFRKGDIEAIALYYNQHCGK
jgi:hypothetical protein